MSLDIYLVNNTPVQKSGTGVFVRENGANRELTEKEVAEKFEGAEIHPTEFESNDVFDLNITHNLTEMADKANLYKAMWRPEELGCKYAKDVIGILEKGLNKLRKYPEEFRKYNPDNGWGSYEGLVECVEAYLKACKQYPDAEIEVDR